MGTLPSPFLVHSLKEWSYWILLGDHKERNCLVFDSKENSER